MSDENLRIAPGTEGDAEVVLKDAGKRERKTRYRDRTLGDLAIPKVAMAADATTEIPTLVIHAGVVVEHSPEPIEEPRLTWAKYIEWRKGKCPPAEGRPELDEVNQAIHEFVGEVAELGELFLEYGAETFVEPVRTKLVDVCGDILFCACWVMDAYGQNPIDDTDGIELLRFEPGHTLLQMAELIAAKWSDTDQKLHSRVTSVLEGVYQRAMLEAQTNAGLLCNSYKKLRYQRRAQDVSVQISRVVGVLITVNQFLVLASSTVLDALLVNTAKLDVRFPDGHTIGGGDRTGKGA
jgi:hypothetical protein